MNKCMYWNLLHLYSRFVKGSVPTTGGKYKSDFLTKLVNHNQIIIF